MGGLHNSFPKMYCMTSHTVQPPSHPLSGAPQLERVVVVTSNGILPGCVTRVTSPALNSQSTNALGHR